MRSTGIPDAEVVQIDLVVACFARKLLRRRVMLIEWSVWGLGILKERSFRITNVIPLQVALTEHRSKAGCKVNKGKTDVSFLFLFLEKELSSLEQRQLKRPIERVSSCTDGYRLHFRNGSGKCRCRSHKSQDWLGRAVKFACRLEAQTSNTVNLV
jgi:hypothetical protein